MGKPDPLAGLEDLAPVRGGRAHRVDEIFGDDPHQLERLRNAFRSGLSADQIATLLRRNGVQLSSAALKGWFKKEGVERGRPA